MKPKGAKSRRHNQHRPERNRGRAAGGQTAVAVPVLDHETCVNAREIWPTSWDFDDPDEYLQSIEGLAGELARKGAVPYYVFIDPDEYVEWCRSTGHPVGSSSTRSLYAGAHLREGDAVPYSPGQPLWPMGVVSMVLRSELGDQVPLRTSETSALDELIDRYTDFLVATPGTYRSVVTASRFADHDEAELWGHFRAAVLAQATLTHCAEYLSVQERIENDGGKVLVPRHGAYNPTEALLSLAAAGHGIFGIEHRNGNDEMTFRAWSISRRGGAEPVGPSELGERLGTPGAPSLRSGWPR
jgi:hypothetical protein